MIKFDTRPALVFEKEAKKIASSIPYSNKSQLLDYLVYYFIEKYDQPSNYRFNLVNRNGDTIVIQKYDPVEGRSRIIDTSVISINDEMNISAYKVKEPAQKIKVSLDHATREEIRQKCGPYISGTKLDFYDLYHSCPETERGILSKILKEEYDVPSFEKFDDVIPAYAFCGYDDMFSVLGKEVFGGTENYAFGLMYRRYEDDVNVEIPTHIRGIEEHAFDECSHLKTVTIHSGVEIIEKNAFANCSGLIIRCSMDNKPSGWDDNWCDNNCLVKWKK